MIYLVLLSLLAFLLPVLCQTSGVRPNLIPCYNTTDLPTVVMGNGRPPTTINVLIEFIRKLEDSNPNVTPRELSALILQRLRQDGITRSKKLTDNKFGVPYSPNRVEAFKSTVLLQKFLTNITLDLNYGDLSQLEICSLHYMISSSISNALRGDESTTCARSSRYTSRIVRDVADGGDGTGAGKAEGEEANTEGVAGEDVRPIEIPIEGRPVEDKEQIDDAVEAANGFSMMSATSSESLSDCPIELGVVYSPYGTIKSGNVLAGIATGLNQETVESCDNRYASTLAGELAEAALVQATESIEIGAAGGWNSTVNPRYFFLQKHKALQATDAELRGSLDGLYMSLRLDTWKSTFSDIKISQILDMYYNPYQRGVFDESFRSCNRNILYTEMVTAQKLRTEVYNFMAPLDKSSSYGQTVSSNSYGTLGNASVNSFNNYLPNLYLSDLSCTKDNSSIERAATDLWVFLDANWAYNTVQSVLSYILDNIDVNKFGTRFSIINAKNGINITNNTHSLLIFYSQYNLSVHQNQTREFDYVKVYEILEGMAREKLNNASYTGGESTIVLFVPKSAPTESQKTFIYEKSETVRNFLPDLNLMVLGTGSQSDYASITNQTRNVIILSDTTSEEQIKRIGQSVVESIKNVPRAIVNPDCTADFNGTSKTFSLTQYVEPLGVNYYRISPNYFYTGDGTRNLKVTENSYGTINVCTSRDQSRPNNLTSVCQSLKSSVMTVDISNYCEGGAISSCSPIYISVTGASSDVRCKDYFCRFPDNIKYTITLENVGCASGSSRFLANFIIVSVFYIVLGF